MKSFMSEDFLLSNQTAEALYHDYAEKMPIIDYHCHIDVSEIAWDRKFVNITQAWLNGDHYKWRMIRSNGVDEKLITGDGTDREKFQAFAEAIPKAIGNPMYHWTHLELKRYFGCDIPLCRETAEEIWNLCNKKLQENSLSVRGIIEKSRVNTIISIDDPVDTLAYHNQIKNDTTCKVRVLPSWRPDRAINIENQDFTDYLKLLEKTVGMSIGSMENVCKALQKRMDFFGEMGCCASDHGLNEAIYAPATKAEVEEIFAKRLLGKELSKLEVDRYKYAVLLFLGKEYADRGWVMELHFGTMRNANTAMFQKLGADMGFDCIAGANCGSGLVAFLDELNTCGKLPRTIIFSINPTDNAMIDTVIGCFQGTETRGKIQHGAAWWFNDTKAGMLEHMISLANLSLLGNFVGMLTDSRSFLSYTRHEYFRRILCDLIGTWVENGEYPSDMKILGQLVQDISYNNAVRYFGL